MSNNFFSFVNRFVRFDTVRAEDVNDTFDLVVSGFDGVEVKTDASIKFPNGEVATALASAAARAGMVLTFDSAGAPVAQYAIADVTTVAGISGDVTIVAGISSAVSALAGIQSAIVDVYGLHSQIVTLDGISSAISAVAAIADDVSAVAEQAIGWTFSTTTAMADPGSGAMRFNNATPSSVTAIALDDLNSKSQDVSAFVATWDDSTSANKGTLTIRQGTSFAVYAVTGLTDNAGWTELAATYIAGGGSFSDATLVFVSFSRTGNTGTGVTDQPTGFSMTGGTTPKTLTVDEDLTTSNVVQKGGYGNQECLIVAISDETTAITTGTAKVTFHMPYEFKLTKVKASLSTVSSSGAPAFDLNDDGTSVFSTTVTVDANEHFSDTAATAAVLTSTPVTIASGSKMTIDIDTAGTGAKGAKLYLIGYASGAA